MYRSSLEERPHAEAALPPERGEPASTLLAQLRAAMLEVAERERQRRYAAAEDEGTVQTRRVRLRATVEAAEFRRLADADIEDIERRSAAEIERIRTRTERRIAVRRERLSRHLVGHATIIDREIGCVDDGVEAFDRELDAYLVRLRAQRDPAAIARLATELPPLPDFDALRADARAAAVAFLGGATARSEAQPDELGTSGDGRARRTGAVEPPLDVEPALVGVMDADARTRRHDAGTIAWVMRTLSALTSSIDRSA